MDTVEAVFECAVFAQEFDLKESERLLAFGYQKGQQTGTAWLSAVFGDQLEDAPPEYQVFGSVRELSAFRLGKTYGHIHASLYQDEIDTDDALSESSWKAVHKREYKERNCSLIGK